MNKQEQLIGWLNDAHMMETEMIKVLESHAADVENNPQMKSVIEEHIEQTKSQAERVSQRIEELGADVSASKEFLGNLMGVLTGPTTKVHGDTMVKNALAEYAAEHFEIACYTGIKAAAESLGDQATATLAKEICDEEKAMAERLNNMLPEVVQMHMDGLDDEVDEE